MMTLPICALLLDQASAFAFDYDVFFWLMVAVCGTVTIGIAVCLVWFAIRYRRREESELPPQIRVNIPAEVTWIVIPFFLFMGMFAYGAKLYFDIEIPPANAGEVFVVAKQWMWKLQHPGGQREINELHVPVNQSIKLTMTSEDAIHSFFVPAFRMKQDVLPDRYTTIWFHATKAGQYHLFCAEYCGTKHSGMIGTIYAMEPRDYQAWLDRGAAEGSLASTGEKLFHQYACANCHHFDGHGPGPNLRGLYMQSVSLTEGGPVIADDGYIRESILKPQAKIVQGFSTLMPTFEGQISEEQIIQLIAYIRAIGPQPNPVNRAPFIIQPGTSGSETQPQVR